MQNEVKAVDAVVVSEPVRPELWVGVWHTNSVAGWVAFAHPDRAAVEERSSLIHNDVTIFRLPGSAPSPTADARDGIEPELVMTGGILANIAFNFKQRSDLSESDRQCFAKAQQRWDRAYEAWRNSRHASPTSGGAE